VPQRRIPRVFFWWKTVTTDGCNPRGGVPFRGDSNTHAIETLMSRAHIKAEISDFEAGK
jgi:hypothetical protein